MDEVLKDSRFSHIAKDARFKSIPKKERKVKIDKRFQSMFTDSRFTQKCAVDKRGRPVEIKKNSNLEKYYDMSDESNVDDDEDGVNDVEGAKQIEEAEKILIKKTKKIRQSLPPEIKEKLKDLTIDYARGEGRLMSDSSSDEESDSEDEKEELDHDWGEMDKDAATTEDASSRIAVCNMDWDRITAQDLMVLFNSFLPGQGVLLSVTIYPSDFGLKRMAEEDKKGPIELTKISKNSGNENEDEELSEEQREKLRQYQLKRLRYFYAILSFDSARTADHIYKECDGLEYESSMNRLDLRFVPDDTTFDQEPKESCNAMPDLSTYTPRLFRTTALTQVKVDLTWDETDPNRQDMIRAVHSGKCNDEKLNGYLAASSSEDEQEDECKSTEDKKPSTEKGAINKYKALLADLEKTEQNKKKEVSMEVTWDLKLEQKVAEKVKEVVNKGKTQTPFEQFLEKKTEKRKKKKEDQSAKQADEEGHSGDEEPETAFSDDDIPSDIDLNDPFFKEEMDKMAPKKKKNAKKNKSQKATSDDISEQEKAELELLMMDEHDEGVKHHFSLKKIEDQEKLSKKKKLKKRKAGETEAKHEEDNFKINVKDERFSAIYSSHLYNVDPAEPKFKATEGMKAIIAEKQRRMKSPEPELKVPELENNKKLSAELNVLVKSVKRKANQVKLKKK